MEVHKKLDTETFVLPQLMDFYTPEHNLIAFALFTAHKKKIYL